MTTIGGEITFTLSAREAGFLEAFLAVSSKEQDRELLEERVRMTEDELDEAVETIVAFTELLPAYYFKLKEDDE